MTRPGTHERIVDGRTASIPSVAIKKILRFRWQHRDACHTRYTWKAPMDLGTGVYPLFKHLSGRHPSVSLIPRLKDRRYAPGGPPRRLCGTKSTLNQGLGSRVEKSPGVVYQHGRHHSTFLPSPRLKLYTAQQRLERLPAS